MPRLLEQWHEDDGGRGVSKPGPMHRRALEALRDGPYSGVGFKPTFIGSGVISIQWRLMAGLVDRGWARVVCESRDRWIATITDEGRKAIAEEMAA